MEFKQLLCIISFLYTPILFAQSIDVNHLSLNLMFDWQKKQANGIAEITLSPTNNTSKIYLDAGYLTIKSVTLNSKVLEFNYDGSDKNNAFEIFLDKEYAPSEMLKLVIEYRTNYENKSDPNAIWGSFGKGIRFFEPTSTTPTKHKQIWSSGEPESNKYWFPCNEEIADIHTTEITATIEKPLMFVATGSLIKTIENDDNTRTFFYKSDRAFPNYLIAFVVGEYVDVMQNYKNIQIHNYGYPKEVEAIEATTILLTDMMQFIEEKTNYTNPFAHYTQIVVQDYPFPGLNGQHALSIISDNYIDDFGVHEDYQYLWDGVAVQAMASQWFGNLIMPKKWEDIWLNNAFTEYFAGQYTMKSNGNAEYLLWYLPFEKGAVLGDWYSNYKHPIVTNKFLDLGIFTSDNYSKYRGALVLRMLQKEVGEEDWWKSMKRYVNTNANKQISTKDFQQAIENTTGDSYQWFFDQWIYKIGLPIFEITKNFDPAKNQLTILVNQIQKNESINEYDQVEYFQGKVEIEIDDKIEQFFIVPKAQNTFVLSLPEEPKFVNFDFEENWICEIVFEKSFEEFLHQLTDSKDVLAKQKALDALVLIANDSNTTQLNKQEIITTFSNEINSNQYWRYRVYALASLRKILAFPYDETTIEMLKNLINTESSWVKTSALFSLGNTRDSAFMHIYKEALNDKSDRVINAAAIALGKTKSSQVFDLLIDLENKPSWKSQSRISALNGLQQLGDTNAVDYVLTCLKDNHSPRWYLATPTWDYPFAAVQTLVALGKAELGYTILRDRFIESLNENDLNDIFQNVQLINLLQDKRATEIYVLLKEKYKHDTALLETVINYENQFLESIR